MPDSKTHSRRRPADPSASSLQDEGHSDRKSNAASNQPGSRQPRHEDKTMLNSEEAVPPSPTDFSTPPEERKREWIDISKDCLSTWTQSDQAQHDAHRSPPVISTGPQSPESPRDRLKPAPSAPLALCRDFGSPFNLDNVLIRIERSGGSALALRFESAGAASLDGSVGDYALDQRKSELLNTI
ncbi:MAG: hypothetical protein Q9222_000815 [Ikaeria aurantiellina]